MKKRMSVFLSIGIIVFVLVGCSGTNNNVGESKTPKNSSSMKSDQISKAKKNKKVDWSEFDASWYRGMWVNPRNVDMDNRVLIYDRVLAFSYWTINNKTKHTGLEINLDHAINEGKIVLDEHDSEIFLLGAYSLSSGEYIKIEPVTENDTRYMEGQKQLTIKIMSKNGDVVDEKIRTEIRSLQSANEETKRIIEGLEKTAPNDWSEMTEEKEAVESPMKVLFRQKRVSYEEASDVGKAAISESMNYNLDYVDDHSFLVYEDVEAGEVYLALMSNDRNPSVSGVVIYNTTTFKDPRMIMNVELLNDFGLLNEDMTIK